MLDKVEETKVLEVQEDLVLVVHEEVEAQEVVVLQAEEEVGQQ